MKKKRTNATINVIRRNNEDHIQLTDMLRANYGESFISDWLWNCNSVELPGNCETAHNPAFNNGEFAIIKSQAHLDSYKLDVSEWGEKTNAIGLRA